MGADNYENLGFQVKIDGADSAVSHLNEIVKRLEKIKALNGGVSQGGNNRAKQLSEEEKYANRVAKATELLNSKTYKLTRSQELLNRQKRKDIDLSLRQNNLLGKTTSSFSKYITKLTSVIFLARRFGQFMSRAIQESSSYVENLNLFAVAYGEAYEKSIDWALNMANAYGLANNEVLKFAGTFRQLSTSLGLVENTAEDVTEIVTNLGYDLSALFNTSVEQAMEKLQSGIFTGQTKPLRAFGIDISQNAIDRLFETNDALKQLGVNARNLSQSDKALARLIITMQTGANSFGTMHREINTLQSQIRIFQGSASNFKLAVGDLIAEPARRALVFVNGLIIALTEIVRMFVPLKKTDETPAISNLGEEAEEANEELEELKGNLASFDKFNTLTKKEDETDNSSITSILTEELQKQKELYDKQLEEVSKIKNEATVLAEKIKKWLVGVGEINSAIEFLETNLGKILITISSIVGFIFVRIKVSKFINSFVSFIETIKTINPILGKIAAKIATISSSAMWIVALIAVIIIGLTKTYLTVDKVKNSVNEAIVNLGKSFVPLFELITTKIIPDLKSAVGALLNILTPLGKWFEMTFVSTWMDMIVPAINYISSTAIPLLTKVISRLWNNILVPLGQFLLSVLKPIIDKLVQVLNWLHHNVVLPLINLIGGVFAKAWESIAKVLTNRVIPKIQSIIKVFSFLWNYILKPIVGFIWDVLAPVFGKAFDYIKNVIGNVKLIFTGIIDFITGVLTKDWEQAWDGVVEIFSGIFETLAGLVIHPFNQVLRTFESFINKIIDGWNWLKERINSFNIDIPEWLGGGSIGFDLSLSSKIKIPKFADGGFTNANFIMTHENGVREWVGKQNNSSAIVNDSQMSDIMEMAVARGVYSALTANSTGNGSDDRPIVIKIGEETVFNVVKKSANRRGLQFAKI